MEYPIWLIPGASKGLLMAIVAVIHVFVAQFAVGGGIYLVLMERKAHKEGSTILLDWLAKHTYFFLLLTMVFGALTGVAIWFTMSLISPAGTSALIHMFVWLWAIEWVFFLLEIVSLLLYHYSYPLMKTGRITPKLHMAAGYIYAVAGFLSLVMINGIITFMLTPGTGFTESSLSQAFFNPTFLPSLFFRTALCLMLAGMWALFMSSRVKEKEVQRELVRINSRWVLLPFLALLVTSVWYFMALPPDRQAAIFRHSADIRPFFLSYGWIMAAIFLLGLFAYIRAEKMRRPLTVLLLCSGLAFVGSFETMRETGRRPWLLPSYMYASSVRAENAELAKKEGVAAVSGWLRLQPKAASMNEGKNILSSGELIFAQQCATCHAANGPRINLAPRVAKLTKAGLRAQIIGQGTPPLDYMPPFLGNASDVEELVDYLHTLNR